MTHFFWAAKSPSSLSKTLSSVLRCSSLAFALLLFSFSLFLSLSLSFASSARFALLRSSSSSSAAATAAAAAAVLTLRLSLLTLARSSSPLARSSASASVPSSARPPTPPPPPAAAARRALLRPWQLVHRCALGSSSRTTRSAACAVFARRAAGGTLREREGDAALETSSKMRCARAKSGSSAALPRSSEAEAEVAYEVAEVALPSEADERDAAESPEREGT